jgi:LysM repeat protein
MADAPPPASSGGITGTLTRKVGPAPLWVYGVVAAVAAFLYIRHSSSSSATPDQATDSSTAADDSDDSDTDDSDEIASDTADDLEDDGDFTTPADTASMPSPPDVTATPTHPKPKGPKGNTSAKLRVVSVTKSDDTVPKFLAKYGVSLAQLRKDNPGRTWKATEKLKPGDKVHIPQKAA